MRRALAAVLFSVILFAIGCGGAPGPRSVAKSTKAGGPQPEAAARAGDGAPADKKVDLPRKIVYTAVLHLIVDDFPNAQAQLDQLVRAEPGAYFARADVSGTPGWPRRGSWTVRVPVEKLEAFTAAVSKLGEMERSTLDAQDVTEEFYDVEADVRNRKVEEEAFLNLEKTATTYDQLLSAKREVARVRNEIDRLQKRLNVLGNLTALSTVTVHMAERKGYVPEEAAGFGTSIGRTFSGSLDALLAFGKGIVLVAVAVAPWLPVLLLVFGTPVCLLRRWLKKRRTASPADSAPVAAG